LIGAGTHPNDHGTPELGDVSITHFTKVIPTHVVRVDQLGKKVECVADGILSTQGQPLRFHRTGWLTGSVSWPRTGALERSRFRMAVTVPGLAGG